MVEDLWRAAGIVILFDDGASRAEPRSDAHAAGIDGAKGNSLSRDGLSAFSGGPESVSPVASSNEKDVETMPTQKLFKQRVRARMTKTGESYTAARRQLLRKTTESPVPDRDETVVSKPTETATPTDLLMSDEAMVRGSGRSHAEWFALLDAWGAIEHGHSEIAEWLRAEQGVGSWWGQGITVDYERARGMRRRHQQGDAYAISVSKTVAAEPARALAAFTDAQVRRRWLAGAQMSQRPTRAALTARFDWSDPMSRVVVTIMPKGADKVTVGIAHERLPDAESAERLKGEWRKWLADLKSLVEGA